MTRGRDVFWGIYGAVAPFLVIHMFGYWEKLLNQYLSRTYDVRTVMYGMITLSVLYGVLLVVLAARFLSRPVETSRIPFTGLAVGVAYCIILVLVFIAEYWIGVQIPQFLFQLTFYTHQSMRFISVAAFYIVVLVLYWKTHTFLPKEELQKAVEE